MEEKVPLYFVRTVSNAEKYCFKKNRYWRHFVAMTSSMSLVVTLIVTNLHLIIIIIIIFNTYRVHNSI